MIICLVGVKAKSQKKIWNDDAEAVIKIDTSQVTIAGKEYRKLITITYQEISPELLQREFQQKKQELIQIIEQEKQQRDYAEKRIESLRAELQSTKEFYKKTAKNKKWEVADPDIPEVPVESAGARMERLKAEFLSNPRRKQQ